MADDVCFVELTSRQLSDEGAVAGLKTKAASVRDETDGDCLMCVGSAKLIAVSADLYRAMGTYLTCPDLFSQVGIHAL